jgi:hypothetical protein
MIPHFLKVEQKQMRVQMANEPLACEKEVNFMHFFGCLRQNSRGDDAFSTAVLISELSTAGVITSGELELDQILLSKKTL